MSLKGKLEAIIYAAEEPVTIDQMAVLLKQDVLAELATEAGNANAGTAPEAGSEPAREGRELSSEPTAMFEAAAEDSAAEAPAPEPGAKKKLKDPELTAVKAKLRTVLAEFVTEYQTDARGVEIRQIAGGYRMATKPEHHDLVVGFAKSLKPPIRLSLQALETLAVVAYKQPVTAPEVSEIRGVDSSGVIATLLDRKLVTTAGRKQVIGRPILYKTTKEFLLRFGLKDVNELPSMEEFEKLGDAGQGIIFEAESAPQGDTSVDPQRVDDAMMAREDEMVREQDAEVTQSANANVASETTEPPDESNANPPEIQGSTTEKA